MGYIEPTGNKIRLVHTQYQGLLVLYDKTISNGFVPSRMLLMNVDTFCCLWTSDDGPKHVVWKYFNERNWFIDNLTPEPVWTTWRRENSWPYRYSNSDPSVVQPVASRYTDYAIPSPEMGVFIILNGDMNFYEVWMDILLQVKLKTWYLCIYSVFSTGSCRYAYGQSCQYSHVSWCAEFRTLRYSRAWECRQTFSFLKKTYM
jgi:hypothetical protein